MRKVLEPFLATAHTFVFAMLPMILVLTSYGGPFQANLERARSLALIAGAVIAVLVALRPLGGSLAARAAATSATLIALSGYRTVVQLAAPTRASVLIERPLVASGFVLAAILIGVAVRRPWDPSPRRTPLLSVLALDMLVLGTGPSMWSALKAPLLRGVPRPTTSLGRRRHPPGRRLPSATSTSSSSTGWDVATF